MDIHPPRWAYVLAFLTALVPVCAVHPQQPTTAPYETDDVMSPLLPTGISDHDVEMFGKFAYTWKEGDVGTVQVRGDFELHMGHRRLRAEEAVIWLSKSSYKGRGYTALDVFLWQKAEIRESGGTVSSGPVFLVTVQTFGKVQLSADATSVASQASTPLYKQAVETRKLIAAREAVAAKQASSQQATAQPKPGEEPTPMQIKSADGKMALPELPKGPKRVSYRGKDLRINTKQGIVTAIGDVYLTQSGETPGEMLEIRANAAVMFLAEGASGDAAEILGGLDSGKKPDKSQLGPEGAGGIKIEQADRDDGAMAPEPSSPIESMSNVVRGAYLDGDVVLSRGQRMIRASEIYYDFENNRALILDAVMRAEAPGRNVPIYVRAAQVRQLSSTEYAATNAKVTSSEFYTPHYYIGAERIYLQDRTARDSGGNIVGLMAGTYEMHNTTFNVGGVPVAYWPYTKGDFKLSETSLRNLRVGYSDDFGATFETKWYMFNLLGMQQPEGYDAWLDLDYYTKRGPGIGINMDYERDNYYGLFRSYYIYDTGEDDLGPFADNEPDTVNRGRITWRHRQYLPKDWELTFEASYISDDNFLQEWEPSEFYEGKEQETLIYAKKQKDNWAFTALAQWRVLDFLTQTEHLPDFGFHLLGQDIAEVATLFSESHAGVVRYKPDNRRMFDRHRVLDNTEKSDLTPRLDERLEVDLPMALGPIKVVPFTTGRGNFWDSGPTDEGGALWRGFIQYGARAGTYLSRVYPEVQSRLLDVNGIKHIIKPDVGLWFAHSNLSSGDLYPFDQGIETIDDFDGVTAGLRQRWQTKRGGPGRWRIVDLLTLDLEFGTFDGGRSSQYTHGDAFMSRPEDSITANFINGNLKYMLSESTAFLWDFNWDLDGGEMDVTNLSIAVERTPRLSYFFGWRYIRETESNLIGLGGNYRLNEKHTLAFRGYYDIDVGRTADWNLTIVRRLPRWYVAASVGYDGVEDDWSISLSAWPEGLPEAAVGSRRFTGLERTTGLRPQKASGSLPPATPTPPIETD
ncbi:MAG: hypothetical protein JXQ73_16995 [Phycisphaerae bacterium]|nr:hypothetical protein [Phycisphaerae bacterium]